MKKRTALEMLAFAAGHLFKQIPTGDETITLLRRLSPRLRVLLAIELLKGTGASVNFGERRQ